MVWRSLPKGHVNPCFRNTFPQQKFFGLSFFRYQGIVVLSVPGEHYPQQWPVQLVGGNRMVKRKTWTKWDFGPRMFYGKFRWAHKSPSTYYSLFFWGGLKLYMYRYYIYNISEQFITTSAEVTPNGGLVKESPQIWP